MGTEDGIWTNEHVTQLGPGRLLCLSSHGLFKCLTELHHKDNFFPQQFS